MKGWAIIASYLWGVGLLFTLGWPIWPWLIFACFIAGAVYPKHWRPAALLVLPVIGAQFIKVNFPFDHLWVYYAGIWATLAVFSLAFFDKKVIAPAGFIIALVFSGYYFHLPGLILDIGTEFPFMFALVKSVSDGPSGGIFASIGDTATKVAGRSPRAVRGVPVGTFHHAGRRDPGVGLEKSLRSNPGGLAGSSSGFSPDSG